MRKQQPRAVGLRIEEERVVHFPGRMAVGKIQPGEVVVVGLDVRPFRHRKAHVGEDGGEFVHHLADRMDAAHIGRIVEHRQGDVDGLAGEALRQRGALERLAPRRDRRADRLLEAVDQRALFLALLRRHPAQRRQQRRDRALLAQRRHPHGFERRLVGGHLDHAHQLAFECDNVGHGSSQAAGSKAGFPYQPRQTHLNTWLETWSQPSPLPARGDRVHTPR